MELLALAPTSWSIYLVLKLMHHMGSGTFVIREHQCLDSSGPKSMQTHCSPSALKLEGAIWKGRLLRLDKRSHWTTPEGKSGHQSNYLLGLVFPTITAVWNHWPDVSIWLGLTLVA